MVLELRTNLSQGCNSLILGVAKPLIGGLRAYLKESKPLPTGTGKPAGANPNL